MTSRLGIRIAGFFSAFFFLFHIPFYWLFDWKHSLACLSADNWAIFHCFNIISILLLFFMSATSLCCSAEILSSRIGLFFSIFCSTFYSFRIIAEFTLFQEPNPMISATITTLCVIPAFLYGTTALHSRPFLKTP